MKKILFVVVPLLFLTQSAFAKDRSFVEIYTQCGLGAMITPHNEGIAAFINITWDSGTTATSSALSSADTCKGTSTKVASFILDNYRPLEKDLAKGNGEHLKALASISTCKVGSDFVSQVRTDFAHMVANPQYDKMSKVQKAGGLYSIYKADLAKNSCNMS